MPWWAEVIGGALGGGGLVKAAGYLLGGEKRHVSALSDTIGALAVQLARSDLRQDDFEKKLADCHSQHEECEQRVTVIERGIDDRVRAEVMALMKGRVARPGEKAPE